MVQTEHTIAEKLESGDFVPIAITKSEGGLGTTIAGMYYPEEDKRMIPHDLDKIQLSNAVELSRRMRDTMSLEAAYVERLLSTEGGAPVDMSFGDIEADTSIWYLDKQRVYDLLTNRQETNLTVNDPEIDWEKLE